MNAETKTHWDTVYSRRAATEVSWYEARPERSVALIRACGTGLDDAIIDIGGGAALLVDTLLELGYRDLSVLDISAEVLNRLRTRLGSGTGRVKLIHADVTQFVPQRRYAIWHDRATFHFLVRESERAAYLKALHAGTAPGSHVILATFGPQGPEQCSALPVQRYDAAVLARTLGAQFEMVESVFDLHHTPGGVTQQFLYCRFRRIGIPAR